MSETDEESPKVYAELTPVMLESADGERTDVKVPYTSTADEADDTDPVVCAHTGTENVGHVNSADLGAVKIETDNSGEASGDESFDGVDGVVGEEYAVYIGLQALFRGLPKEMFINRILSDSASCDIKLGEMRSALFEQLKEEEDFPYGLQAMLKRRVFTRSGDSVATKLAHDVHTLMSVIEGAEYTDMRELLSSGNGGRSQRSQSQSCSGAANETIISHDFTPELKVLSETVNSMKADMLKMKQSHLAVETTRSKQIDTLKSTVLGLKADLTTLSNTVSRAVTDIRLSAERIESEKSLGVTNLKSEIRLMKGSLASIEDTVFNMQTQIAADKSAVSQPGKTNRKTKSCHLGGSLGRSNAISSPNSSAADSGSSMLITLNANNPERSFIAEPMGRAAEVQQSDNSGEQPPVLPHGPGNETDIAHGKSNTKAGEVRHDLHGTENDRSQHSSMSEMNKHPMIPIPNEPNTAPGASSYRQVVSSNGPPVNRNDAGQFSGNTFSRYDTGQSIHTRVTRNNCLDKQSSGSLCQSTDNFENFDDAINNNDDDDDFQQFVKKKAKRYYLGGFKPSISRQRIENYVNRRGPTVTWIRIWNSKRRPNNVIIRLNVEDNDRAKLLESATFWPRGVTCRPWEENRARSKKSRDSEDTSSRSDQLSHHIYGRSDIDDYNPFSPLRDYQNI